MKEIMIIGCSFGGLTTAFELRHHLRGKVKITVSLNTVLSRKGIRFVQATVQKIDPERQQVELANDSIHYDYLVIATGSHLDFEAIPGLGPEKGYTQSIMTLEHAIKTNEAWQRYLEIGGPIVVGSTQGVSCFGPAYEFIFGVEHVLWKLGLREKESLTFVSSEPYISHFGLGGFRQASRVLEDEFAEKDIKVLTNTAVKKSGPNRVILKDGTELPFAFSMFVPPFRGVDAVAITPKEVTPIPTGVPKTGFMTEHMSKIVAQNIAAEILGKYLRALPVSKLEITCIADLGKKAAYMTAKPTLPPRQKTYVKKGRFARVMKVAIERYFLFKFHHRL